MKYQELIERNLTHHAPSEDCQIEMADLRRHFKAVGTAMLAAVPEGREKSLAVTNLEQSLMWCMAAMARHDFDEGTRRFYEAIDHSRHCHALHHPDPDLPVSVLCCLPNGHEGQHNSCPDIDDDRHTCGPGCHAW